MLRLFRKRENYMRWKDFKARIDFLDTFLWQQDTRKNNLKAVETFTL